MSGRAVNHPGALDYNDGANAIARPLYRHCGQGQVGQGQGGTHQAQLPNADRHG